MGVGGGGGGGGLGAGGVLGAYSRMHLSLIRTLNTT